jgi:DNA transformation protein and related proteins
MTNDLSKLKGIGPKTRSWLEEIGIHSIEDLRRLGAVETYKRLKAARPREVSLNALYGLEAALTDTHWLHLPDEVKAELRAQVQDD